MLPAWHFAPDWVAIRGLRLLEDGQVLWALSERERSRCIAILEALHAHAFGLSADDFRWVLRDCDHPQSDSRRDDFTSRLDPKGFWRVDKDKDPELRHTVLAQVAYADLCAQGLDVFLAGPNGDGWQLPETLRLSDYNLGHDDRAQEPQPVGSRLGPRFLDWQIEKGPDQFWLECEAHASQLSLLWNQANKISESDRSQASTATPSSNRSLTKEHSKPDSDTHQKEFKFD